MIHRTIEELSQMITIQNPITEISDIKITGVSFNTNTLEPGNLFIPLKGEHRDGHEFVKKAFEQGAAASLWQADIPNPPENIPLLIVEDTVKAFQQLAASYRQQLKIKVVGVTGSNGKTTTKDILAELLAVKYKVQKTIGNYNNELGLPFTILSLQEDTEVAVLEMGMSAFGEIELLSNIAQPDAAIITNIGEAHLQDLGSREGIAKAKLEILSGLNQRGILVYPGEEALISQQLQPKTEENSWIIQTFGKLPDNDLFPTDLQMTPTSSIFKINQSNIEFQMPVLGEYNVLNALAAMLVASHWGVTFDQMQQGFSNIKLSEMRLEMTKGKNNSQIINDAYNASPTSMKAVIDLAANLDGYKKKILVLGDMLELGPKEEEFHKEVGQYIPSEKIDYVFTYGTLAELIAESAKQKFEDLEKVAHFNEKDALIKELESNLEPGTLTMFKASRGMKLEEIVTAIGEK